MTAATQHRLTRAEADVIGRDLAKRGIRVQIRLGAVVHVCPIRPVSTGEEVQVLAALLGCTDQTVRWHDFEAAR
jgi:hypothetical protein